MEPVVRCCLLSRIFQSKCTHHRHLFLRDCTESAAWSRCSRDCCKVLNQLQMLTKSETCMTQGVNYMDRHCKNVSSCCSSLGRSNLHLGKCAGHERKTATDEQRSGLAFQWYCCCRTSSSPFESFSGC